MHGLILFAHGARDTRWAEPFLQILALVSAQAPGTPVRLAFLELMEPGLPAAAAELVSTGCTQVTVQPLFLGTGGHLRRDLPLLMQELAAQHPAVHWHLQAAIGEHPAVIHAISASSLAALGVQASASTTTGRQP